MNTADTQERQKLIVLIIIGVMYSIGLAYLFATLPNQRFTDDFYPRWYASNKLLTTDRSLYDWANATEISAVTGWPHSHQLGYYYPAYLLIFTGPLSMVPPVTARIIWTIFGLWCLWLSIFIFARLFKPNLSVNRLTIFLVLFTTAVPIFQHTLNAQFNALGVLALAVSYQALYKERYFMAGVWASGLLFKPQTTLIPLIFFALWTLLARKRWSFLAALAIMSVLFWGIAELLEPNWVTNFLQTLNRYETTKSLVDSMWNPYQLVSLTLLGITVGLIFRLRHLLASATAFSSFLAFTISLNALIVPLFGMLHIVLMGPVFIILTSNFRQLYPAIAPWIWRITVGLFVAGLLAFIIPLIVSGTSGLHITSAEVVYKITMPMLCGLAALFLFFSKNSFNDVKNNTIEANKI